eukprot:CAMPEP_0176026818 /NCGR_PEP_ID=MMETSP0120_2-20121206/13143_1 /TAXON_ID=160619 /ORGANISM="Kryptoperidinium foliaceum, Strain CCMP 1326" /LENGTH=726 /DNA_ID=CAMNT_0017360019 /DNA_START=89 /DNA_END=2269 /DNA_ORIENTATION=+
MYIYFTSILLSSSLTWVTGLEIFDDADEYDGGVSLLQYQRRLMLEVSAKAQAEVRLNQFSGDALGEFVLGDWGLNLSAMNTSVPPGDDFYDYVNGVWLKTTEIPSDETSWSSFALLGKQVETQVHGILKSAPLDTLPGLLYHSFMDESTVNALGAQPLKPDLDKIMDIRDAAGFAEYVGTTNFGLGSSPFSLYIDADPKRPDFNVAHLGQSGLGLPSRDYYLQTKFDDLKQAYGETIGKMLDLAGWPDASAAALAVLKLEERIANVSWPKSRLRDPNLSYNKMTPGDLPTKAPGFAWEAYMRSAGDIPSNTTLIVSAYSEGGEDGVVGIARVLNETALSDLRSWAAWHLVRGAAGYLSEPFADAKFDFYNKRLAGQVEQSARWKRAVSVANSFIGDAVGEEFVRLYFPDVAKRRMDELTELLRKAFAARIQKVSWMTDGTKSKALDKLHSFRFEVGRPKKFRSYDGLKFTEADLFGNLARAIEWDWRFDLQKLGQKVDDDYWGMPPQVVNAFFDPTKNKCVFLAAILQPPFFSADGDMSVNFGGIGAVIGHEMTHGFDDQGRQYDAEGKLNDWWTQRDAEEFNRRAKAYGEQFANFTRSLPPGAHIKPELTMGENIADLGGLTIAYDAYHLWLEKAGSSYAPEAPLLMPNDDGLEGDRRYFAGWGQVWRAKYTDGALQMRLLSDPHSPGPARGIVPVQNSDAWYAAYHVGEDQAMFLDASQRVQIW